MSAYQAPLAEMQFVMNELAGLNQIAKLPGFVEATPDTVTAILEEAAKFATNVLDPLNGPGDREGAKRMPDGSVKTPAGFKDAYWKFVKNGWNGLTKSEQYGGQGLPQLVATAVEEMWHASNMAFDLCPLLTQGAIEAIELRGSDKLKATYLPKMVEGSWTGTMNLTEPQAGSDLAAVRTRAVPQGTTRTNCLGKNLHHVWRARLHRQHHPPRARTHAGCAGGCKGNFSVRRAQVPGQRRRLLGQRNDVLLAGLFHKMGYRGTTSTALNFGDNGECVGYLVGKPHAGLSICSR